MIFIRLQNIYFFKEKKVKSASGSKRIKRFEGFIHNKILEETNSSTVGRTIEGNFFLLSIASL